MTTIASRSNRFTAKCCAILAVGLCGSSAAAEAPPPAAAFARLPDLAMVRLTPDGKTVAFAGYRGGKRLVSIVDLSTGNYLRELLPDSELKLRDLNWADNRTLLMTISKTLSINADVRARRKYEFSRIVAVDTDGITHQLDLVTAPGAPAMMER